MDVLGVGESQRGILLMDLLLEVRNRQMLLFEKGVGTSDRRDSGIRRPRVQAEALSHPPTAIALGRKRPREKGKTEKGKGKRETEQGKRERGRLT